MIPINPNNALLLDLQYVKPDRRENKTDYLYYIYRDYETGEKKLYIEQEPTMDIYFEKKQYRNHTYIKDNMKFDQLDKVNTKFVDVIKTIANEIGPEGKQALSNIYNTRNFKQIKMFHCYPYVFGSDIDITAYKRVHWAFNLPIEPKSFTLERGHFDIEVDLLNYNLHHDLEKCPIDLITLADAHNKVSYSFALVGQEYVKPHNYDSLSDADKKKEDIKRTVLVPSRLRQEQAIMDDVDGFIDELKSEYNDYYGDYEYKIYFYKDELKMITHFFELANMLKLDFITAWNISFDIPETIARIKYLGGNPDEIIPHKDFPSKECYFKKDNFNMLAKNKSDAFIVSGYTRWLCAMNLYAQTRKSGKEPRSLRLNDVAFDEIGDEKLCADGNLKKMAYEDYRKYFMYNIKDVLLLDGIESKVHDLDGLFNQVLKNGTPYEHISKPTILLNNFKYLSYLTQGIIPGNNPNVLDEDIKRQEEEKRLLFDEDEDEDDDNGYEGALVGDPLLNEKVGANLYGSPSNSISNGAIDMDMSSFYIYTIICLNIAPTTLIFKVICDASQYDCRGGVIPYNGITNKQIHHGNTDTFIDDIAKEIFDNYQTGNYLSFGNKFMNLPSVDDILQCI